MKLCSDILYQELSHQMDIIRSGKPIETLYLEPPIFWYEGTVYEDGKIYIGRADEFPEPPRNVRSLLLVVGGRLPSTWHSGSCCVFCAQ